MPAVVAEACYTSVMEINENDLIVPDTFEEVTERDHAIMKQHGGRIVRHVASGMIGHAYPWHTDNDLTGYVVLFDYTRPDGTIRV